MGAIVLYFQVHQPYRVKPYSMFGIGEDKGYFDSEEISNKRVLEKVADKCYLPSNKLLLKLCRKYPDFKVSFSISGVVLEQLAVYAPEVIESFRKLTQTGQVELLGETYYHSLAFLFSKTEFESQVNLHRNKLNELFGFKPKAFRNTELIYNNLLAKVAEKLGFTTVLAEGVDRYLGWRSPNFVYRPKGTKKIRLLLKNYRLSDDIAFRFSNRNWSGWPLTAIKFADWIDQSLESSQVVNLFLDYETFGEHQWKDSGIFEFMEYLPKEVLVNKRLKFMTVSEASEAFEPIDEVDMPVTTSWADSERDVSAWLANPMQNEAAKMLFGMEKEILATDDEELIRDWRLLSSSDHFYYMSVKKAEDGEVHSYFSPHKSAYEAFVYYMNVLHDLEQRVYTYTQGRQVDDEKNS